MGVCAGVCVEKICETRGWQWPLSQRWAAIISSPSIPWSATSPWAWRRSAGGCSLTQSVDGRRCGLAWTRFPIFCAAAALVYAVTLALARRLDEPQAASLEELLREMLVQSPQRFWLRFWPRG